jgi:hypothetical protein
VKILFFIICLLEVAIPAFTTEFKPPLPMQVSIEAEVSSPVNEDIRVVRRAAFDVGGGSIRMLVADVNTETDKIVNKLFCGKIEVKLNKHLEAGIFN